MTFSTAILIQFAMMVLAALLLRELSGWPIYSALPLIVAFLNFFLHSRFQKSEADCGVVVSRPNGLMSVLMVTSALIGAVSGLVPMPLAVFMMAVTFAVLTGFRIPHQRPATNEQLSLGFFSLILAWGVVLLGMVWPRISACSAQIPPVWAELTASAVNTLRLGLDEGLTIGERGLSFISRSGVSALSTEDGRVTLLLNYENLHVYAFTLCYLFGLVRLTFEAKSRRLLCYTVFSAGLPVLFLFHCILVWAIVSKGVVADIDLWKWKIPWSCLVVLYFSGLLFWIQKSLSAGSQNPERMTFTWGPCVNRRETLITFVAIATVSSLAMLFDPGTRKQGRVLIDESHSKWERSDLPTNAEFFGTKSTYNYGFLREILGKHYRAVRTNRAVLSRDTLSDCDVLVLKTPTRPYSRSEIQAVHSFVESGGGVWLIGDHTNIFGMNTYLNQICEEWGFTFSANSLNVVSGYYEDRVRLPNVDQLHPKCGKRGYELLYSRPCLNHPIIGRNIPYCTILTSCSLKSHLLASAVNISEAVYSDDPLFGSNTFFGNHQRSAEENYGSFYQALSAKSGYGRVAAWSDSTLFSNFSMCMPGVPELSLGYVEWLNRKNSFRSSWLKFFQLSLLLTLALVGFAILVAPERALAFALMIIMSAVCTVPLCEWMNQLSYPPLPVSSGFRTVGFDQQYGVLELPTDNHVHDGDPEVFESFFVNVQRLHGFPYAAESFSHLLEANGIVICNPRSPLSLEDMKSLKQWVAGGGRLLLMVNHLGQADCSKVSVQYLNEMLSQFGSKSHFLSAELNEQQDLYGILADDLIAENISLAFGIAGTNAAGTLLQSGDGNVVCSSEKHGEGLVILCSTPHMFSNASLGEPTSGLNKASAVCHFMSLRLLSLLLGDDEMDLSQQEMEKPWRELMNNDSAGESDAE
ncbi:MAG: DUF4350 domain-containing protein [Planctomycetaceae bacterium]